MDNNNSILRIRLSDDDFLFIIDLRQCQKKFYSQRIEEKQKDIFFELKSIFPKYKELDNSSSTAE